MAADSDLPHKHSNLYNKEISIYHFAERRFCQGVKGILSVCKQQVSDLHMYYKLIHSKLENSTLYHLLLDLHCGSPQCTTRTIKSYTFSLHMAWNQLFIFRAKNRFQSCLSEPCHIYGFTWKLSCIFTLQTYVKRNEKCRWITVELCTHQISTSLANMGMKQQLGLKFKEK